MKEAQSVRELLDLAMHQAGHEDWARLKETYARLNALTLQPVERAELQVTAAHSPDIVADAKSLEEAANVLLDANKIEGALEGFLSAALTSSTEAERRRNLLVALGCAEAVNRPLTAARVLVRLGKLSMTAGNLDGAEHFCRVALRKLGPVLLLGARAEEGIAMELLGDVLSAAGRSSEANQLWTQSYEKLSGLGHGAAARVKKKIP